MTRKVKKSIKGKNLGIGLQMAGMLVEGLDTKSIIEAVRKHFPGSTASRKDVSIIRCRLRRGDFDEALGLKARAKRPRTTRKSTRKKSTRTK